MPPSALASGGNSVAAAPMLSYGQLTAGGGLEQEFWHLQLYAGDKLSFTGDLGVAIPGDYAVGEYGFTLYDPAVNDYTLREAHQSAEVALHVGKNAFNLTSPFTGVGTLDVCEGLITGSDPCGELAVDFVSRLNTQAEPYSFTATVTHAVSLTASTPTLAGAGTNVTVRGRVSSPAGTPQGNCLIAGKAIPVTDGKCSGQVRLHHGHRQTIHISFVGSEGWQNTSTHRTIRLIG